MPEKGTRFVPKPHVVKNKHRQQFELQEHDASRVPYYGTGVSREARLTSVGTVNPRLYGDALRVYCKTNEQHIRTSGLRVEADNVTSQLAEIRRLELGDRGDDSDSVCSDQSTSRWQSRDTKMKYTGSLDGAKRSYFELEDIDDRTDMGPIMDPINGFCYLCTTQEEHRQHLKSEKRVHGQRLRSYDNPVPPGSFPTRSLNTSNSDSSLSTGAEDKAIYKVVVKTGNQASGGTDAQVTLRMYGLSPKHKTAKIVLKKSGSKFIFMRDSTNTFSITAENFPEITSIEMETDGYEKSQSWFLDSVTITNMKTKRVYYFPCSDWLSLYHKGESIVKKLQPAEQEELYREYEVTVVTGAHKHSGIDSKVYLTLVGAQGHRSKKCNLAHKDGHCFQRGAVDTFPLTLKDIGTLSKIRIEHDDKGKSRRWLLLLVFIKDLYSKRRHIFYCNQWLVNEEGNATWREIPSSKVPKGFDIGSWGGSSEVGGDVLYEVNVHTGDVGFAGTDANIMIQFYGEKMQSRSINLSEIKGNYDDPFEKNQIDIFQLKAPDVGEIKKIKIGHDNHGVAAGWYLEKVLVRKFVDVKTRVAVKPDEKSLKARKGTRKSDESETSGSSSSSESETDHKKKPFVIGRNNAIQGTSSPKSKRRRSKEKKKARHSEIHSVTRSKVIDASISDSDRDADDAELFSGLSDEDDLIGSATDLQGSKSALLERKKAKEDKRRRRMDNLSDVAEITETSSESTSVWDSEEMLTTDKRVAEALRLKQEHDKLTKTMETVVPKVEEYTFICKQWFAESEGDGKIERILKLSEMKVYNLVFSVNADDDGDSYSD